MAGLGYFDEHSVFYNKEMTFTEADGLARDLRERTNINDFIEKRKV